MRRSTTAGFAVSSHQCTEVRLENQNLTMSQRVVSRASGQSPLWVQKRKWSRWNGRSVLPSIVLQKSFGGDERNFLGPLMRFARRDVRDLIASQKNDHGASCPRYRALQRRSRPNIDVCEISGVVRFSTFATLSPQEQTSSGHSGHARFVPTTEVGIKNLRTQSVTLGVLRVAAHPKGAPYLSGG